MGAYTGGGEPTRRRTPLGHGYTWTLTVLSIAVEGSWTLNRPRAVRELVNKRVSGQFREGGCGGAILSKVAKRERNEIGGGEGIGHYAVQTKKVVLGARDSTVAKSQPRRPGSPPSPGSVHPPM